jgi:hypothetical protein
VRAEDATELARRLADGHAWSGHASEFPECADRESFAALTAQILEHASHRRALAMSRVAYWHDQSGTIVIVDPASEDGGTVFRPRDGRAYFERIV